MPEDDAELVALIDNELDEGRRTALWARLAADVGNCASGTTNCGRLARQSPRRFDLLLLAQAPLPRLRALLPLDRAVRQPSKRFAGIALRELAAGIAIGLVAAGAAAWVAVSFWLPSEQEDWRSEVAEYTNLYTSETFSPLKPDAQLQGDRTGAPSGPRWDANLTPENVALPGLRFTMAFMLSYDGAPLGVVAYVDPSGAPVLLCIIANEAPDTPMRSERRDNLSLAWWSRGGRSRLVIGRIPEERAVALAQTLEKRI